MKNKRKPRRDSEKCSIVNRTVSFNIEDPFQRHLLDVVDTWTNFSGGVKRLIAAAIVEREVVQVQTYQSIERTQEEPISFVSDDAGEWDPTELL